jgi:hypothetical protein
MLLGYAISFFRGGKAEDLNEERVDGFGHEVDRNLFPRSGVENGRGRRG